MGRHTVRLDATAAQTAPEAPSLPPCSLMKSPPHTGQPRKRTGGTGAPAYEVQAVAPAFAYGIPTVWVGCKESVSACYEPKIPRRKKTIVAANSIETIAKTRFGLPVFLAACSSHFDKVLLITIASENLKRWRRTNLEQALPALYRAADAVSPSRLYRAA
jgi:hypothetical protein